MKDLVLKYCTVMNGLGPNYSIHEAVLLTYNNGMTIYVTYEQILGKKYLDAKYNQVFASWTIEDDGLTLKYGKFEACVREIYKEHLEKLKDV